MENQKQTLNTKTQVKVIHEGNYMVEIPVELTNFPRPGNMPRNGGMGPTSLTLPSQGQSRSQDRIPKINTIAALGQLP